MWRTAALAALALAAILAVVLVMRRVPTDAPPATRFTVGPPPNAAFTLTGRTRTGILVSVSPDGRHVVHAADSRGARSRLWIRSIDLVDARPIEDADGGHCVLERLNKRAIAREPSTT